jgi:hypothetical protein
LPISEEKIRMETIKTPAAALITGLWLRDFSERELFKNVPKKVKGSGGKAGDGTRTRDLKLGKLAFYQLNYSRNWFWRPFLAGL